MSAPALYERGDTREDVLPKDIAAKPLQTDELPADPELFDLTAEQYWEWLSSLVEEGSQLDQELDKLLDAIYDCQPSFFSLSGRRRLRELLDELHDAREAVRAFEYDVEELTYVFARTDAVDTRGAENANMTLAQIKTTYDRAYDLCLYKLDRMGNSWITASNFLISIVMLIVTILFWMEFR